jgi:hypothetical protein
VKGVENDSRQAEKCAIIIILSALSARENMWKFVDCSTNIFYFTVRASNGAAEVKINKSMY